MCFETHREETEDLVVVAESGGQLGSSQQQSDSSAECHYDRDDELLFEIKIL